MYRREKARTRKGRTRFLSRHGKRGRLHPSGAALAAPDAKMRLRQGDGQEDAPQTRLYRLLVIALARTLGIRTLLALIRLSVLTPRKTVTVYRPPGGLARHSEPPTARSPGEG